MSSDDVHVVFRDASTDECVAFSYMSMSEYFEVSDASECNDVVMFAYCMERYAASQRTYPSLSSAHHDLGNDTEYGVIVNGVSSIYTIPTSAQAVALRILLDFTRNEVKQLRRQYEELRKANVRRWPGSGFADPELEQLLEEEEAIERSMREQP